MGLEYRHGRPYFTKSRREGGRVVREYVGAGWMALVAAEIDDDARAEREATMAKRRAERVDHADLRQAQQLVAAMTDALVTNTLTHHGYHQHKGEWRRRRRAGDHHHE